MNTKFIHTFKVAVVKTCREEGPNVAASIPRVPVDTLHFHSG